MKCLISRREKSLRNGQKSYSDIRFYSPISNRISPNFCTKKESDEKGAVWLSSVRGMNDLLPQEKKKFDFVTKQSQQIGSLYGFDSISTPLLEKAELFHRSLGVGSDVVMKEMYTFEDQSGTKVAIRPENTASAVRALINAGQQSAKWFYSGPMFRYERPQKGRLRQFHQIGVEHFQSKSNSIADIEIIALGHHVLSSLGLANSTSLQINSLGDRETREKYTKTLEAYFTTQKQTLSKPSQERLERGSVLRILDSKDPLDASVIQNAPKISDCFSSASKERFEQVKKGLNGLGIQHDVVPTLVRGLDYYSETIFEFVYNNKDNLLGKQQATVLAGGRYDQLSVLLGAPRELPAVGWAAGIERLVSIIPDSVFPVDKKAVGVVVVNQKHSQSSFLGMDVGLQLTYRLREKNISVLHSNFEGSVSNQLQKLTSSCDFAIIIGEDEWKIGKLTLKNLTTGQQKILTIDECVLELNK